MERLTFIVSAVTPLNLDYTVGFETTFKRIELLYFLGMFTFLLERKKRSLIDESYQLDKRDKIGRPQYRRKMKIILKRSYFQPYAEKLIDRNCLLVAARAIHAEVPWLFVKRLHLIAEQYFHLVVKVIACFVAIHGTCGQYFGLLLFLNCCCSLVPLE